MVMKLDNQRDKTLVSNAGCIAHDNLLFRNNNLIPYLIMLSTTTTRNMEAAVILQDRLLYCFQMPCQRIIVTEYDETRMCLEHIGTRRLKILQPQMGSKRLAIAGL